MSNRKWNNFYMYFPGMVYRTFDAKSRMCSDLGKILAQMNFDNQRFNELVRREGKINQTFIDTTKKLIVEKRDLTPDERERELELVREIKKIDSELCLIVDPIYNKMRGLGYSHHELAS